MCISSWDILYNYDLFKYIEKYTNQLIYYVKLFLECNWDEKYKRFKHSKQF